MKLLNVNATFSDILANIFSIFVEFEAEKLGIASPPPYLSLSKDDDALLKGVNYASGGAGILNDTGLYFVMPTSFQKDLFCFKLLTITLFMLHHPHFGYFLFG